MDPIEIVSSKWLIIFAVEVPIVLATGVYWTFFGEQFMTSIYGKGFEGVEKYLLQQYAAVICCYLGWFYGRWIFSSKDIRVTDFCYFQEAALLGDIYLVLSTYYNRHLFANVGVMLAQAGAASFWGILRVIFMLQVHFSKTSIKKSQ